MKEDIKFQQRDKKKILFIINPKSGTEDLSDINERIGGLIDYTCFEVEGVFTERRMHAFELAKQAVADGIDYVVAVGGDGTVNEVASALVHTQTIMGIVPVGSGNGLARHLRLPGDIDEAIEMINRRTVKYIDSVEVNQRYFFNIAGLGFDAHVASEFVKNGTRGIKGYRKIIAKEYFKFKPSNYEIFTPDENLSLSAFMICIANGKQWGNGAIISPKSSVSDGVVEICILTKVPALILPFTLRKLFSNNIETSKYLKRIKCKNAVIIQKNTLAHLDGESAEIGERLDIKVHPSSLHVLVNK
jgi:YegS/Rv2252/BmrU family lipid kinase